nr:immunoglobulin light chain junction region [Macaca mulatta]MOV85544.1 immunoglobulin light chain junction region [Macaca mulatta]MOW41388.1 immunoglobulin light chain junction region [Macaca mulatta]MOW42569.1 immunoglobulin light chain junction region [Macaca mulatta]MOW54698.1 immunoglobulin light chain junction region [Macaca mulatta]
YMQALEFPLTF